MEFSKTTMGTNIGEFLGEHLTEPRDKESVRRFMRGNKLAYGEANHLIRSLLHSLIIQDGKEGEEIEIKEAASQNPFPDDEDSIFQTQGDNPTANQGTGDTQPRQSGSGLVTGTQQNGSSQDPAMVKPNFRNVCKYYRNGDCKYKDECRKEHPRFCNTFVKNGLLTYNTEGCDGKCGRLHPNACRSSLRTKECDRIRC